MKLLGQDLRVLLKKALGQSWALMPMAEMLKMAFFLFTACGKLDFFIIAFFHFFQLLMHLFVCVTAKLEMGKQQYWNTPGELNHLFYFFLKMIK